MTDGELRELKDRLRTLLVNDIGAALKALKKVLPENAPRLNDVLSLEGRLNDANLGKLRGIISTEDLQLSNNRIRTALMELISALEPADFETRKPGLQIPRDKTGSILYKIPTSMVLGKETPCIVRLAFEEESIVRNIELTEDTKLKPIRISTVMDVTLLDPNPVPAFSIRTLSTAEQFVEQGDYTEWIFFVNPLKEGTFSLMLKVSVVEIVLGKERKKEIVLEESVQIVTEIAGIVENDPAFKSSGYMLSGATNEISAPHLPTQAPMQPQPEPANPKRPESLSPKARPSYLRPIMAAATILLLATVAITVYQQSDMGSSAPTDSFPVEKGNHDDDNFIPAPEPKDSISAAYYSVRLILNPDQQNAMVRIDGRPATVTDSSSTFKIIRVRKQMDAHRIELQWNGKSCVKEIWITEDQQELALSCF